MKKIFTLTFLVSSIFSFNASAVTEGHYLSIDGIDSHVRYYERYKDNLFPNGTNQLGAYETDNNDYGVGLTYKYAINFNKLYFAPGVFYEYNNAKAEDDNTPKSVHVKNRYGVKMDMGYDVALGYTPIEIFSLYVTGGYSGVKYETNNLSSINRINTNTSGTAGDWFYGAGFKVDFGERFFSGMEYTRQNFLARTRIQDDGTMYSGNYKTRLDVVKLSLGYKF